ncbi:MAG: type II secretion system protein [Phycisphaerales bacterium]|nr:type II secretion system protein [Planctomycetota bacterium]MBL6998060.1 type II secretion system protein [Phycisphaerales bacterium]
MNVETFRQSIVHRRGWTLIELLTTVAILVVSSYVLIPYATSGDSSSGQSATRMVVTEILAAQMDAVATQGFRRIHFFEDGSGWCVEKLDSDQLADSFDFGTADFVDDAIESQGQGQQSITRFTEDDRFSSITISKVQFDGNNLNVIFDPTGGIIVSDGSPSTGGSIELRSGKYQWKIQLAPLTGKVTVIDLGGGA